MSDALSVHKLDPCTVVGGATHESGHRRGAQPAARALEAGGDPDVRRQQVEGEFSD